MRSSRRTEPTIVYKGIVLTCVLLTVLAGIKLGGECIALSHLVVEPTHWMDGKVTGRCKLSCYLLPPPTKKHTCAETTPPPKKMTIINIEVFSSQIKTLVICSVV